MRLIYDSSRPGYYSSLVLATRRHADVDECLREFGDWLPTLEEITLPVLTFEMLFDAVHAKSPSAGDFDG